MHVLMVLLSFSCISHNSAKPTEGYGNHGNLRRAEAIGSLFLMKNFVNFEESSFRKKRSPEERDHTEHLANDGNHLWNLGDYHESTSRRKRSPEERDHTEHLANDGNHLWNLGDYHESTSRRKRSP